MAANLVLQGDESAALIPEGLDLVPKPLSSFTELDMAGHLRFGPLDHELGSVGGVIGDQLLLLSDRRGQRGDKAFLLELEGDAVRDVGDCLGFTLTRLLETCGQI